MKSLIVEKLKTIKNMKYSLLATEAKKQIDEVITKEDQIKSSKDWQNNLRIIKNQFEFEIKPKIFSLDNLWREVIYMNKINPIYQFTVEK